MSYASEKEHVLHVLNNRGPSMSRRQLLMLLRHNFRLGSLVPVLAALESEGLVKQYRSWPTGSRGNRKVRMVGLTEAGHLQMMLA